MIRFFVLCLMLISFSLKSQDANTDSLQVLFDQANDKLHNCKCPDLAIENLNQIIAQDSSFYKIYYARAVCYFKEAESELRNSKNELIHAENDSNIIARGIKDIHTCIKVYNKQPKKFPENMIWPKDSVQIPLSHRLGDFQLRHKNVFYGLDFFMSKNNERLDSACYYWNKASDVYGIESLTDNYCK